VEVGDMVMTIAGKKIDTRKSLWQNIGAHPMVTDAAARVDVARMIADDRAYRKRLEAGEDIRDVFKLRDCIIDTNAISGHNVDEPNSVTQPKPKGKGSAYYMGLLANVIAAMMADPEMAAELSGGAAQPAAQPSQGTHSDNEGGQVPNAMVGEGTASRVQGVGDSLEGLLRPTRRQQVVVDLDSFTPSKGKAAERVTLESLLKSVIRR
jgi:hypothetical protein